MFDKLRDLVIIFAAIGGVSFMALAKTSTAFQEAQAQATTARLEANKAKIKYDSMKAWTDLVRTSEATRRAEIDKGL